MKTAKGFRFDRRGLIAALLAGAALAGCGKSDGVGDKVKPAAVAGAVEKTDLKLGFINPTDMAPLAVARENGFFADEGLNFTLEPQANWKVLLDGVAGGQLDGAHMLASHPLASAAGIGSKVTIITPMSLDLNRKVVSRSECSTA